MLIVSAKSGQLGNRLLLFAHFIAFAIEHNLTVINPAFNDYAEFFCGTKKDFLCCYPALQFSIPWSKKLGEYYYKLNRYVAENKRFNTIDIQRDKPFNWTTSTVVEQLQYQSLNFFQGWLFRDGWFVDDITNLHKHGQAIRTYFQPLKKYQDNVEKLIFSIRSQTDILIGVHIRHGDYQQHQNGRYFYPVEDYVKIMESTQVLFPGKRVTFLICSNEKQQQQYFQHLSYTFANNHIIEDLYSLAQCDYIIGPPSSFTMWASFYGERPLYMIRDINKVLEIKHFVNFNQWQGVFHSHKNWSKSYWEWTH